MVAYNDAFGVVLASIYFDPLLDISRPTRPERVDMKDILLVSLVLVLDTCGWTRLERDGRAFYSRLWYWFSISLDGRCQNIRPQGILLAFSILVFDIS